MKSKATLGVLHALTSCFAISMIMTPAMSHAATLVSHWTMNNNPEDYANTVSGGPAMVWDSATKVPSTFDDNETRLETSFDATKSTRFAAVSSTLNLGTFSFSLIMDPTDMIDYGSIITKETAYAAGAVYENIGWQVQHNTSGDIELVVRGNAGGYYGGITVTGATSGMPAGGDFGSDSLYQIAGGYDATTGATYLYVTALGGTITSLTGGAATFGTGAAQDGDILSLGTKSTPAGYDGNGAGFDVADLQIYDSLLTESELLTLANNPGQVIPEPASALLGGLGMLVLLRRRR